MILNKRDFGMITIAAFKMSYQRSACRPGVTIVGGNTIETILVLRTPRLSQRHGDSQLVETLEKNMAHACDGFPSQVDMAVHLSDCPAVRKSGVVPRFDFGPQTTRQAKESPCYLHRENTLWYGAFIPDVLRLHQGNISGENTAYLSESWQTSPPTDFVTI
ncbi:predicted protein [Histoplasma capsulatum var. duboisii H88]|uniref:Predicted protein n=1 Tax=Ajellomyces capsulatus (strain H88) TaxID=544711 RepID=F0UQ36_AJEC8|nr:predicted protein [Histoplasma capsulatum var. duboisii H88]